MHCIIIMRHNEVEQLPNSVNSTMAVTRKLLFVNRSPVFVEVQEYFPFDCPRADVIEITNI